MSDEEQFSFTLPPRGSGINKVAVEESNDEFNMTLPPGGGQSDSSPQKNATPQQNAAFDATLPPSQASAPSKAAGFDATLPPSQAGDSAAGSSSVSMVTLKSNAKGLTPDYSDTAFPLNSASNFDCDKSTTDKIAGHESQINSHNQGEERVNHSNQKTSAHKTEQSSVDTGKASALNSDEAWVTQFVSKDDIKPLKKKTEINPILLASLIVLVCGIAVLGYLLYIETYSSSANAPAKRSVAIGGSEKFPVLFFTQSHGVQLTQSISQNEKLFSNGQWFIYIYAGELNKNSLARIKQSPAGSFVRIFPNKLPAVEETMSNTTLFGRPSVKVAAGKSWLFSTHDQIVYIAWFTDKRNMQIPFSKKVLSVISLNEDYSMPAYELHPEIAIDNSNGMTAFSLDSESQKTLLELENIKDNEKRAVMLLNVNLKLQKLYNMSFFNDIRLFSTTEDEIKDSLLRCYDERRALLEKDVNNYHLLMHRGHKNKADVLKKKIVNSYMNDSLPLDRTLILSLETTP